MLTHARVPRLVARRIVPSLPGLAKSGVVRVTGAVSFTACAGGLAVAQAVLGRPRRVAVLQILIAVSRLCPGWLPGLSGVLRGFGGPLLALWTYGLTARLLLPSHWRSLQFWKRVFPIYCAYKKTQLAVVGNNEDARSKIWAKRHEWGARKVYDLCVGLRGFYLKDGQYLGSRTDFIPGAWCEALRDLQDHVPPVGWSQIERTITESYKINNPRQLFGSIEKTPLASATIAQVHRAEMPDGTQVIVKTQYADQRRLCELDLRNLKRLAAFLQKHDMNFFDMKAVADEFDVQIPMEFDFVRESEAMTIIAENLAAAGIHDVVIPRVIPGLATPRTITMTFEDGVRPDNAVAMKLWGIRPESVAMAVGRAVGQMMLVDGFMHADIHLGNILVLRDGRVCLLDFGQSKRLPEDLRVKLCEFYLALCSGHRLYILKTFGDLGIELETDGVGGGGAANAEDGAESAFLELVPTYANGLLDTAPLPAEVEISPFSERSPLKTMPIRKFRHDLFMVLRAMGLLRALCDVLDVELAMSRVFAPYARAGLLQQRRKAGGDSARARSVRSALTAGVALPFEARLPPRAGGSGTSSCTVS